MRRLLRWFKDARYWIMYRTMKRHAYHRIDTGLTPGYYDYDTRILHGMFAMLEEYIAEMGGMSELMRFTGELRGGEDEHCVRQADHQEEAVRLSVWWNVERPADLKSQDDLTTLLFGGGAYSWTGRHEDSEFSRQYQELRRLENKIHDDEQSMLKRLVDIRPTLWI